MVSKKMELAKEPKMIVLSIGLILGLFFIMIGMQFFKGKQLSLLRPYSWMSTNAKNSVDKKVIGKIAGTGTVIIGLAIMLTAILLYFDIATTVSIIFLILVVVLSSIIMTIEISKKANVKR